MKRIMALGLVIGLGLIVSPAQAGACSCSWRGPFFTVAKDAPLVVRARILTHHPGPAPTMDVLVLETLAGGLLARLTPPLHFAPNPREIEGWQLSDRPDDCSSRPYAAESGPGNPRCFIFSPAVGEQIDGPKVGRSVNSEEVEMVRRFGRGALAIESFRLEPGKDGCPKITWLKFSVQLDGGY